LQFEKIICRGWDEAMQKGVFRYSLDDMKTRRLPGKEGYILQVRLGILLRGERIPILSIVPQLNLKRGIERRKPEFITGLDQPYDPSKFNFTKVKPDEIICELCPSEGLEDFPTNDSSNGVHHVSSTFSIVEIMLRLFIESAHHCCQCESFGVWSYSPCS
jgi:hypothetical protein